MLVLSSSRGLYVEFVRRADLSTFLGCHVRATAAGTGAAHAYINYREPLDRERPDGVFVIGPPAMQERLGSDVLERGLALFTEKPSATSVVAARRMRDLARERATWGQTGFMKRWNDAYRAARACPDRPEFGQPLFLEKYGSPHIPGVN